MTKRIIAIVFIFICTSLGWAILGGTLFQRTYDSGSVSSGQVASLWGTAQNQAPPTASYKTTTTRQQAGIEMGVNVVRTISEDHITELPLESSKIDVDLDLQHRQKGLLWYSTYKVKFAGVYGFRNTSDKEQTVDFKLPFPTAQAIYDNLIFTVDGNNVPLTNEKNAAAAAFKVAAGKTAQLAVSYSSQGLNEWRYGFGGSDVSQVRDFTLHMKTNFKDIDFPDNTLAPLEKHESPTGWQLDWTYKNLLSGYEIALAMPEKAQPGPLASQISFFAPVSLFFFFFLIYVITTMQGRELHPMNYFFLACAFFAFHLLLAYLVDHVDIFVSFGIAAAVSVFLVVSYLRIVAGPQFAIREAALTQFVYLILFSAAFFFRGFTGLTITIGSILTLFIVMQLTARVSWPERFASSSVR